MNENWNISGQFKNCTLIHFVRIRFLMINKMTSDISKCDEGPDATDIFVR